MYLTPYRTNVCPNYDLNYIKKLLNIALINDEILPVKTLSGKTAFNVFQISPLNSKIPQFFQPILMIDESETVRGISEEINKNIIADATKIIIDTRPFIRINKAGEIEPSIKNEYQFSLLRAFFLDAWIKGEQKTLLSLGDIPHTTFIRFLTNPIVRRLALTPLEQQQISVIAGFYYLCLFNNPSIFSVENSELIKVRYGQKISSVTKIPSDVSCEITSRLSYIANLNDFILHIKEITQNPKIDILDVRLIISLISGSWFGAGAKEIVATSLEYPPNFLALVYMSLTDRSYHSTYFTKLIDTVNTQNSGNYFVNATIKYLEDFSND